MAWLWKQHGWETALGPVPFAATRLYSALLRCVLCCTGLLHSALVRHLQSFSSSREMQSSVYEGKGDQHPKPDRSWLIWTKVPTPVPWLFHLYTNEHSKSSQFDWSKWHCPDRSEKNCSDWPGLCISDWIGKASVLLVEIRFPKFLYRACSNGKKRSVGRQFNAETGNSVQALCEVQLAWDGLCRDGY